MVPPAAAACRPPAPCRMLVRPRAARQGGVARRPATAAQSGSGSAQVREVLDTRQRSKLDRQPDSQFYSAPRFVHHLDAGFRQQLTQLYRQRIPAGGDVLDLCSSWVSHLPPEVQYGRVAGHGMNAQELARNPRLSEFFVRDLNKEPPSVTPFAFADASFDAVLCVAGLQYMQQPEAVIAEVRRVLKPGGMVVISFSNRMFYEKAITAWRDTSDYGRCQLVKGLLVAAGGFSDPELVTGVPLGGSAQGPLQQVQAWAERLMGGGGDPFFAVVATKL